MFVSQITLPIQNAIGSYTPAYDNTGVAGANLIAGETQTFVANTGSPYTFIIPSYAPYYTASMAVSQLGANLIANPGPFTAATGWTAPAANAGYGGGTLSVSGTALRITNGVSGGNYAYAKYTISTVIGKAYQINVVRGAASNISTMGFYVGTAATGDLATLLNNGTGSTYTFTATATTTFISFNAGTSAASAWSELTSITVNLITPMVLGVDYRYTFPMLGASRSVGQAVYGGILFLNSALNATVTLTYQTLGGVWVPGQVKNAAILLNCVADPCATTMEQVAGYSTVFPPTTVAWDRADAVSLTDVETRLKAVRDSVAAKSALQNYNAQTAHLANYSNPHSLTVAQVGLTNVANLPPASNASAAIPTNGTEYISVAQVNSMMQTGAARASTTTPGVSKLNLGIAVGDDSDNANFLTATGFSALVATPGNAIRAAIDKGQVQAFVTPFPLRYPVSWNSQSYNNQDAFTAAVAANVGISPLEFNSLLGCFWFPANTTPPALVVINAPIV